MFWYSDPTAFTGSGKSHFWRTTMPAWRGTFLTKTAGQLAAGLLILDHCGRDCSAAYSDLCGHNAGSVVRGRPVRGISPPQLRAGLHRRHHFPLPEVRLRVYRRAGPGSLALFAMWADQRADPVLGETLTR